MIGRAGEDRGGGGRGLCLPAGGLRGHHGLVLGMGDGRVEAEQALGVADPASLKAADFVPIMQALSDG